MLLDRMAYGQKLWPITLHHHKTPIHTIAYLDHGRVSDVTLPLTPRGSMTRARAARRLQTKASEIPLRRIFCRKSLYADLVGHELTSYSYHC